MPSKVISGPDSEKVWDKAVAKAEKSYPGDRKSDPDKFYAIAMTIYKKMCTKSDCSPKAESRMVGLLRKFELLERVSVQKFSPNELAIAIGGFIDRYRPIGQLIWDDETRKGSTGNLFLQDNPGVMKKFVKFRDAYHDLLSVVKRSGKYLNVRSVKPKGRMGMGESEEVNEAVEKVEVSDLPDKYVSFLKKMKWFDGIVGVWKGTYVYMADVKLKGSKDMLYIDDLKKMIGSDVFKYIKVGTHPRELTVGME